MLSTYPRRPKAEALTQRVDVVVRLHDPTDPSTERTAPPSSAHVQLDDIPPTSCVGPVGKRSNLKKTPTHAKDHGDA